MMPNLMVAAVGRRVQDSYLVQVDLTAATQNTTMLQQGPSGCSAPNPHIAWQGWVPSFASFESGRMEMLWFFRLVRSMEGPQTLKCNCLSRAWECGIDVLQALESAGVR